MTSIILPKLASFASVNWKLLQFIILFIYLEPAITIFSLLAVVFLNDAVCLYVEGE